MGAQELPDKMQAVRVVEFNKPYKLDTIPTPDPAKLGEHDLLLKVAVASLCHTDSMVVEGKFPSKLPQTASHEGAGTVVAVGSAVKDFKEGDRVMCGIPLHPCGKCNDCKGPEKFLQYCQDITGHIGVTTNGAFADYVICDSRRSAKLPDAVTFGTAAPLACAGSTVWRGILTAEEAVKNSKSKWIAIVGSGGGLGHLGCQFARAKGLKVVGIDARDEGLELTKQFGADVVLDARKSKEEVVKQLHEETGTDGVEATIVVSDADSAANLGCAVTRMHGLLIQIAQPPKVWVDFQELVFRDIHIHGSLICSPSEARDMLQTVADHNITVHVNEFEGLESVPKIVELAHSGKMQGKGVCIVDKEQVEHERKIGAKT